jgi:hypothetical protein
MRMLAVAASVLALHAVAFQATLTVGTHSPAVNTRWPYAVKVVDAKGKPLRARVTMQVVDPLGTVHPVAYYANTKSIVNVPFRGTFRDAVKWPPESRGFPITFRAVVTVGKTKRVLKVVVLPS